MARPKNLIELIDQLEPGVRDAFFRSIASITSDVQFAALEAAIKAGNAEAAMRIIGLGAEYFNPLDEALRAAHIAGAEWTFAMVKAAAARKGIKISGMFDSRNLRAENLLRKWSSERVVAISDITREAVRTALTDAITRGTHPRAAALDLVGRIGPNGVRTGGVIGLDPTKLSWVDSMRRELSELDPHYFTRALRDKRYDAMVQQAIESGKPIPQKEAKKITEKYTNRLLQLRGETVARTEMLGSVNAAKAEGLQQLIETGEVQAAAITNTWVASRDKYTRKSHREANGQSRAQGEYFEVGGHFMMYPGDQSAPPEEVINCRCYIKTDIDFTRGLKDSLTPEELFEVRALM